MRAVAIRGGGAGAAPGYRDRFQRPEVAAEYDHIVGDPDGWEMFLWRLQRRRLLEVVEGLRGRVRGLRYLDFATGTGRVLEAVAPLASEAVGVDVSGAMLATARRRVPTATLVLGDILERPWLLEGDFDLITAFRFFLNVEPELRLPVLTELGRRLRTPAARLVFNIHRNRRGLDGVLDRLQAEPAWNRRLLGPSEVFPLVRAAGLRVEWWSGVGVMPAGGRRLRRLRPLLRTADLALAGAGVARGVSRDLMFVCSRP